MKSLLKFLENFADQMLYLKRSLTMTRDMRHQANKMYKKKLSIKL